MKPLENTVTIDVAGQPGGLPSGAKLMPLIVQMNRCAAAHRAVDGDPFWRTEILVVSDDVITTYGEKGVFKMRASRRTGAARVGIGFAADEWRLPPEELRDLFGERVREAIDSVLVKRPFPPNSSVEASVKAVLECFFKSPMLTRKDFDWGPIRFEDDEA